MKDLEIVVATRQDVSAMAKVDTQREPATLQSELEHADYVVLKALGLGQVQAAAAKPLCGYLVGTSGRAQEELHYVFVDRPMRRQGVGRALVMDFLDRCRGKEIWLEVRTDNAAAIALYRDVGFSSVGQRAGYYGECDAMLMTRPAQAESDS